MRNNLFLITLIAGALACVMLMGTGGAQAMLTIDDFDVPQNMVATVVGSSKITQVPSKGPASSILGGYRDARLHLVTDNGKGSANIRLEIDEFGSGYGELLTSVFGGGHHHTTYDGEATTAEIQEGLETPPGNLNADFITGLNKTGFHLDIIGIDTGVWDISLTVFDQDSGNQVTKVVSNTGQLTYEFASFSGIDFTDVKAIRFEIENDPTAGDISWDTLHAFSNIPEPGTLVLLGLGVLGIFGYGWRRRKTTK